jgi:hypothetical protein
MRTLSLVLVMTGIVLLPVTATPMTIDSTGNSDGTINKGRLTGVITAQGVLYFGSLAVLNYAWYSDYSRSSFHFYNDIEEWQQIDKCGHAISSYYISNIGYASYRWAGLDEKRSALLGGVLGFAYLLNIELLDGFSSGWGFSAGDLAANTFGSALFVSQQLGWHEQRIVMKYSYHPTSYATYRPDALGNSTIERALKDYNGHTYWLSGNISSFLHKETRFPKWLNMAVGYGAEGMTGGFYNPADYAGQPLPSFTRYRKFFLSVDVDLTRIPVRSRALKGLFTILSFIKIPAPTLEYNTLGDLKFHVLYF